jgi:hypothetical protein
VSDAKLACVEVRGHLAFATDRSTRLRVTTVMVLEGGHLEVGRADAPVAADAVAEIEIADQPIDTTLDPAQIGNGIVGLGRVTMHGAAKSPTFVRLGREPMAGATTLTVEQAVSGWRVGDSLALPDTRQLRSSERAAQYRPQDEVVEIASIAGAEIRLTAPLKFDHRGAGRAGASPELLPHVGNISRNVIVRSENPEGTRGHTLFISRADVDLRYAQFVELGRTRMGVIDSAEFSAAGAPLRVGQNQIGRYAVHLHHAYGPQATPANGHQFTLIGNAVTGARKWGVVIHHSHHGLIQDNVVYNTRGAGIVTEDGTESFNVFDHNFSMRSIGAQGVVVNTGYGATGDPGGEGGGFWFRGPNNYIRNNVAANAEEFGFGMAPGPLGIVRTPAFKGADTSRARESIDLDTGIAPVLEFANNEAYGVMQSGVEFGWSGTLSGLTVWHASRHGISASPTSALTVDGLKVRGDATLIDDRGDSSVGAWFGDYMSRQVVLRNSNVDGMRIGVASPFFYNSAPGGGQAGGSFVVENGFFRTQIGINVATAYAGSGGPAKTAEVRQLRFEPLQIQGSRIDTQAISMTYGMNVDDPQPRVPITVYDFNKESGNNFKVYFGSQAPGAAPCHETRPAIGGWVCR